MSRLSPTNEFEQIEKKLSKMEDKMDRSRRRVFSCFNCLVYFAMIILALFLYGSYILAKTGLAEVPYFTEKFFKVPEPVYVVEVDAKTVTDQVFINEIIKQTSGAFARGETSAQVTLNFTEEYLTARLNEILVESDKPSFEFAQASIDGSKVEVFLHKKDSRVYITADIVPEFADGKIKFDLRKLKLGNSNMPTGLGNLIIKLAVGDRLSQLARSAESLGEIKLLTVKPKSVEIILDVSSKSQIFNRF
jgi:hypothetical protein